MKFACSHFKICSGCDAKAPLLKDQQALKFQNFISKSKSHQLLNSEENVHIHDLGDGFLRTRLELTWQHDHWGFWSHDRNEIIEINECHQIDPKLNEFYRKFKLIKWPMEKASMRLRMSPQGRFGIWLDLANEDVRDLFESKNELHQCLEMADVEIGQRRKSLSFEEGRFRLKDPEFKNWISTFIEGHEVYLSSLIGGFSQTGPRATQVICSVLEKLLDRVSARIVLEFGSGFGTLTLPTAGQNKRKVLALEVDERSTDALRHTLIKNKIDSVAVLRGDFQKKKFVNEERSEIDTYLVNPPRSGVQNLLLDIPPNVKNLIYMSCFEESFFKDSENLKVQGFRLDESHLIDQFPQTPHTEWMTLWTRS